jgi:O-antigen biosynthesis protein
MSKNSSVSIIIPTYNGRALLEQNLPAVLAAAPGAEVLVVDDASTDDTADWLSKNYPAVKVLVHEKNQRFAAACNSGVAAATGEVVVLLNNDVVPGPTFLTPLMAHFKDEAVFAVGCAEYDGEHISGRSGGDFLRGMYVHWRATDQIAGPTLWVSGGSGAFRKATWDKLGGMDTAYAPAYEEDRDICYRALKRGNKILFEPKSIVRHSHETTNKKALGQSTMKASSYKNQFLFVWKNISSRMLIRQHLAWLPYQLTIALVRSKGMSLIGFLWGLTYIPQIYRLRKIEQLERQVADETIIAAYRHL